MKKLAIGFAATALALGLATPVSAGELPTSGTLVATPDPVYQGGSTVITPTDDDASLCEGMNFVKADPAFDVNSEVSLEIVDPDDETIVEETFETDDEGDWSFEVTDLETLGEYTVYATCELPILPGAAPAAEPDFEYAVGTFEVIAQATTTTTAAPTTTTAAAAAVTATPAYTG